MSEAEITTALAELSVRRLRLIGVPNERRKHPRLRLNAPLPAQFARIVGTLTDVSATGARFRCKQAIQPLAEGRLTFTWGDALFTAAARVLSSRIAVLDTKEGNYESRVEFIEVSPESKKTLDRVVATLTNDQLRRWVANFMDDTLPSGHDVESEDPPALLRYRFLSNRWVIRRARIEEPQPPDGFILPASMREGEVKTVCAAYSRLDRDGRQLLRLFTRAALER